MIEEQHDFAHEHPEFKAQIHELKTTNSHFSNIFLQYDSLNKDILRSEKGVEVISDERLEEMKKKRLLLKDELVKMLKAA